MSVFVPIPCLNILSNFFTSSFLYIKHHVKHFNDILLS
jgi:hypothetical protein